MSIEFLLTSLVVGVTPGTGVLYTMAAGLSRGIRASVIASVGCTLGIVPHMLLAITGLAALLNTSAVAFQVLKYLGAAYLLYMAWSTFNDKSALAIEDDTAPRGRASPAHFRRRPGRHRPPQRRSATKVIVYGILVNILNPKLTIFFFAFLPQFVGAEASNVFLEMVELSAVFMLLTFVVFIGYGAFASAIRSHVISRPQVLTWMRRGFSASFAALGARLVFMGG